MSLEGRVWVFGDSIDTDLLAPGPYMRKPLPELARHCLEAIAPDFASQVQKGDILVGGEAFGIGSSREQAAQVLIELGIQAVVAKSFARIFYRNALNLGLPALVCPEIEAETGERLALEPLSGRIVNLDRAREFQAEPIPEQLMAIVNAGGLLPYLKARFSGSSQA